MVYIIVLKKIVTLIGFILVQVITLYVNLMTEYERVYPKLVHLRHSADRYRRVDPYISALCFKQYEKLHNELDEYLRGRDRLL